MVGSGRKFIRAQSTEDLQIAINLVEKDGDLLVVNRKRLFLSAEGVDEELEEKLKKLNLEIFEDTKFFHD